MTDKFIPDKLLAKTGHLHFRIDHAKALAAGSTHTKNVENFWGSLKRGIADTYLHASKCYLQIYTCEFCFRHYKWKNEATFDYVAKLVRDNEGCVSRDLVINDKMPQAIES